MNKITEEQLKEYVVEVGEFEKEHRKYSSFYCWSNHIFTQEDIETLKEEGIDASDFLNVCVSLSGIWEDGWGAEWGSVDYCKVEEYQELVPEVVIPAHYVTKTKSEPFTPVWE